MSLTQAAFMYCLLRDLYCAWVLFSFLSCPEKFPFVLFVLSLFVFLTDALIKQQLQLQASLKHFLAVSLAVWFLGASLRRPFHLLSFALLASSLLSLDAEKFLQIPREPLKHAHAIALIAGAVGGSIFVPLDWGTQWQKFPMPVSIGLCIGSALGRICNKLINYN